MALGEPRIGPKQTGSRFEHQMRAIPYLGTPASFAEAFPGIGHFTIKIQQGDPVWGGNTDTDRQFSPASPPPAHVDCMNPNCRGGGLDLQTYLDRASRSLPAEIEEAVRCPGHERSQRARRCHIAFRLKIQLEASASD